MTSQARFALDLAPVLRAPARAACEERDTKQASLKDVA